MIELDLDNNELLLSLMTNGKSKIVEDYNVYEEYYRNFKEKPSALKFAHEDVNYFLVNKIREQLKEKFSKLRLIFKDDFYSLKYKKNIAKREIWYLEDGYILVLAMDGADTFFTDPKKDINQEDYIEITEYNTVLVPNIDSKYKNDEVVDKLIEIFGNSMVEENKRTTIGMVAVDGGELYVKNFPMFDEVEMKYMDLHYGEGFEDFNDKLIKKLKKDKKGLVLLHGLPGTGKTHYIRYLLSQISKEDKSILYFPPSMVEAITEPNFINFINTWVNDGEKDCIILIEDAEPLLTARDEGIPTGGITNLLNLTDGLLNDIFGIQIIATFNTDLSNLDKALLRPERLIARKSFNPLSKEDASILMKKLDIKKESKDKMTLADIYSIKKDNEILLHDLSNKKQKIGFNR